MRLDDVISELATKPGHDKVKASIQDLLGRGLGAERAHVQFEKRVPEAQGRIDAILGRTAFEVKSDLTREIDDEPRPAGEGPLLFRRAAVPGRP